MNANLKVAVCIIGIFIIASCTVSGSNLKNSTKGKIFCDITSKPLDFDGKTVVVVGSIWAGPEGNIVIQNKACRGGMLISTEGASDNFAVYKLKQLIYPSDFPENSPKIKVRIEGKVHYFPELSGRPVILLTIDHLEILDAAASRN